MEKSIGSRSVFEVNVREIIMLFLKKWWLIGMVGLTFAVGAWAYSTYYITPYYRSSAKLYIISKSPDNLTTLYDLQTGTSLAKDFMILVKSRPVMDTVIQELGLPFSGYALAGAVSLYNPPESRVLEISITSNDPYMAKTLVDKIASVSAERMVDIMGIEKVTIVEEGSLPYAPFYPNTRRNMMLYAMMGGVLVCVVILMVYLLNDHIKTSEDIEKYLDLTTLGIIPMDDGREKKLKIKKKARQIQAA